MTMYSLSNPPSLHIYWHSVWMIITINLTFFSSTMIAEIPNCSISLFSFVGFILVMEGMTFYQLPVGFKMGNPGLWVRSSHTAPVPVYTVTLCKNNNSSVVM